LVKSFSATQPLAGCASGPVDDQWYDDGREQPLLLFAVVVGRGAGGAELAEDGCEEREPDDGAEPVLELPVEVPVVVPAADADGELLVGTGVAAWDELLAAASPAAWGEPFAATGPTAWGEPLELEHAASVTAEAVTATKPTAPRNALRTR
jgi:hypothetical protein